MSLAMRFYLVGYSGCLLPRTLRRLLARTTWHRAWLAGYAGVFEVEGRMAGALDRKWYAYRGAPPARCDHAGAHARLTPTALLLRLMRPFRKMTKRL